MARPVTLFTGPWKDLPLEDLARQAHAFGYDGLELACGAGDHFDVAQSAADTGYAAAKRQQLEQHDLECQALSAHRVGQAVCDPLDARHQAILPEAVWGDGDPAGVRARAAAEMMHTARAAQRMGVEVVNGFTGSEIWHLLYAYPAAPAETIERGFANFAVAWNPILDVFGECGVRFALEVHPAQIAFDIHTAHRALEALGQREEFGFNFDPSHLLWQGVDPVEFLREFGDRIFHVHVQDAQVTLNGKSSILSSHLAPGDPRRGWDFRGPGRGGVNFEEIIRALQEIDYTGPLSVEWSDPHMDREQGAREACEFVRRLDFTPAHTADFVDSEGP